MRTNAFSYYILRNYYAIIMNSLYFRKIFILIGICKLLYIYFTELKNIILFSIFYIKRWQFTIFRGNIMEIQKTSTSAQYPTDIISSTEQQQQPDLIFALDIGTRSVIGIVAEKGPNSARIIDTERLEHKTRSMLDGQIHDVPQVAQIISAVKEKLEEKTGPLKKVSVAAAGRALYTMTAEAQMEVDGIISPEQQKHLDFIAVQTAQKNLAASNIVKDTSLYYCVGYSTVYYLLDGTKIKSLIGQRGRKISANVIATFLPRQVVDSMQSALNTAGLEMQALTLEPIAAISVLIPTTMRHLNLALVDIGAGTSDVAITKDGSVIAYGMVPMAGDEITEAISKYYLLDFNVAEDVKRKLASGTDEKINFCDILGMDYSLAKKEIIAAVINNITELAQAIANQILTLNDAPPQAVMLVGGGSLTPHLAEEVAKKLDLPIPRVAVRMPDKVDDITDIPDVLKTPDAVTPLGILKTASMQTLSLISMYVNGKEYHMFNFKELTVADVLLNAGINLHKYNGKPGLGIMVNINGKTKILSGSMGTLAKLKLNGKDASLSDIVPEKSHITIENGTDGAAPAIHLRDIMPNEKSVTIYINDELVTVEQFPLINGIPCHDKNTLLNDKDEITIPDALTVADALATANYNIKNIVYHYTLNGMQKTCETTSQIKLNRKEAYLSDTIHENDEIDFIEPARIALKKLLKDMSVSVDITVLFNDEPCIVHTSSSSMITANGNSVSTDYLLNDGDDIICTAGRQSQAMIGDVLLAANFTPPKPDSKVTFQILKNGLPAEFTTAISENDHIKVILTPLAADDQPQAKEADNLK
ncbi:cell division protein FtsA [Pectinatus cerevisiiphilus]|uniref:Cell division protein FtsA n=2 Tax=Pectinatus cerevisiiphilus TaxID=86956 RepID=A0A4V2USM3_9FIRM|nr:cell division protein FtsA [Pectinatus cerevisiiphilus]